MDPNQLKAIKRRFKTKITIELDSVKAKQFEAISKAFGKSLEEFIVLNLESDLNYLLFYLNNNIEELEMHYEIPIVNEKELDNIKF